MKNLLYILLAFTILGVSSCKEDEFELGEAPTSADAIFTFSPSTATPNIVNFSAARTDLIAIWDFGNGTTAKGAKATATYPRKGTYTVSLTIFNSGGSATTVQDVVIAEDDFSLLDDPLFTFLTGGVDSLNGKTWVIDSATVGHFGVGPNPIDATFGDTSNFYSAGINEKVGAGFYDDRYVFKIDGFQFDMLTKGIIYLNSKQEPDFPGSYDPGVGDLSAPFPDQLGESWLLKFDAGEDTTLTVSGNSFLGYNTGVSEYKVIRLTENSMYLSYEDDNDPALRWYIRLIPAGFVPTTGGGGGGGGTGTGATLPIDFEMSPPVFENFGGNNDTVIDNPDPRGINQSAKVLSTTHGNETFGGISVELANKLDFSTDSFIVVKVWSPVAGRTLKMKIEDKTNASLNVEADISIPVAFTWIERKINFGAIAASGTFDKFVLFPGFGTTSADTYYIDDLSQE